MGGLEEKAFGFGRETVGSCSTGKKKIVLTLFAWVVKLDRCQNFK